MKYKIYVDLDEVLVDYRRLTESWGIDIDEVKLSDDAQQEFWAHIDDRHSKGETFWGGMVPMPDALELWQYVRRYDVEVLTAGRPHGNPFLEKSLWVRRYLGDVKLHLVPRSGDKAKFAAPNHILIDDKVASITPWVAAGGIGILHTSAESSITQLQQILHGD